MDTVAMTTMGAKMKSVEMQQTYQKCIFWEDKRLLLDLWVTKPKSLRVCFNSHYFQCKRGRVSSTASEWKITPNLFSIPVCIPLSRMLTYQLELQCSVLKIKVRFFFPHIKITNSFKISASIKWNNRNLFAKTLIGRREGRSIPSAPS